MTTTFSGAATDALTNASAHRTAHRRMAASSMGPGARRLAGLLQQDGQLFHLFRVRRREVLLLGEVVGQVVEQRRVARPAAGLDVLPRPVPDRKRAGRAAVDEHGRLAAGLV